MKRAKFYVGLRDGKREAFKSFETPTDQTHGQRFNAVIGPFGTLRGAMYMASNPYCNNIKEAEQKAKKKAETPDLMVLLKEAEATLRWAVQEAKGKVKAEIVGGWLHHADKIQKAIG